MGAGKKKRTVVGQILKSKDPTGSDYIKVDNDVSLTKGMTLSLESKAKQISRAEEAMKNGKLTEDVGNEILERLNKIPDFVRFQIVLLTE